MQEQEHAEEAQACSHRWMIESPNGPTSRGKCMDCGAQGVFKNSIPVTGWERSGSRARKNASKSPTPPSTGTTSPASPASRPAS